MTIQSQVDDTVPRSLESNQEKNAGDPNSIQEEELQVSEIQERQQVVRKSDEEAEQDVGSVEKYSTMVPQESTVNDELPSETTVSVLEYITSTLSAFDEVLETASPQADAEVEVEVEESEQAGEDFGEVGPASEDEYEVMQTEQIGQTKPVLSLDESGDVTTTTDYYEAFPTGEVQSVTTDGSQITFDYQYEEMQTELPDGVTLPGGTFLESHTTEGSLSTTQNFDQITSDYQDVEMETEMSDDGGAYATTPEGSNSMSTTVFTEYPSLEDFPDPLDNEVLQDMDVHAVTVGIDPQDAYNATLFTESAFTISTISEDFDGTTTLLESPTTEDSMPVTTDSSQTTDGYQTNEVEEQPERTTTPSTPEESNGYTNTDYPESPTTEGLPSVSTDVNQITSDYYDDIKTAQPEVTTLPSTNSEESSDFPTTTLLENLALESRPTPFDSKPLQATDVPAVALITDSPNNHGATQSPSSESTTEFQQTAALDDELGNSVTEVSSSLLGQEEKETKDQEEEDSRLPNVVNSEPCGLKGFWNHVMEESTREPVGGVAVSTVEWCWVVAIMERRSGRLEYLCSGALVESDIVLTTASCLKRLNTRDLYRYIVVLGDSNLREDLPYGVQFHSVSEVVIHPDFSTSGNVHANDLGMLRLIDHATLSHQVCLVCLSHQDVASSAQNCVLSGYSIAADAHGDLPSTVPLDGVLRRVPVSLLTRTECQKAVQSEALPGIKRSPDSFLCSRDTNAASACYGSLDGGSPLACEVGGRWFLSGLVSWSRGCAVSGGPTVYTRLASFTDWFQGIQKVKEAAAKPSASKRPSTVSPEDHTSSFNTEALQGTESPVINVILDYPDGDGLAPSSDGDIPNDGQQTADVDGILEGQVTKVPPSLLGQEGSETPVGNGSCGFKGSWNNMMEESTSDAPSGVAASTVEWCWMAAIMWWRQGRLEYLCSGALVESDLVLTTASCLKRLNTYDLHRYIVVLGDSNLREDLPYGVQFHAISEVVIHPYYSTFGKVHTNDIGIIMLRDHATFSYQVCPVCLAQQDAIIPSQNCVLTSYGVTDTQHAAGPHDMTPKEGILRKLSVPLLKEKQCREALRKVTHSKATASSNSFLCAGSLDKASVCHNTMAVGSPLACGVRGRWFLAGLASWAGGDCTVSGSPGSPNVYTRMTAFSTWLQESAVLLRKQRKTEISWRYSHLASG
ncbi:transmembrane protease serine 9-like isoform X2 [Penaeus japonicus]|uniref:transmembrane protease serine 9-like isoform X2 n=1 Tax=Penaeus japonicus TaxID=27405 RepID=UPI001C7124BE|nr:transmembrane protease serine 9-like isoform X2 [Penaeus japonicus]